MPSDVFNFVHVFILNYKINVNASQSEKTHFVFSCHKKN